MKRWFLLLVAILISLGGYALWQTAGELNGQIITRFAGQRWDLPARIYARPLELYAGSTLQASQLSKELALLHYTPVNQPEKPGDYSNQGNSFIIHSRTFHFPDGIQPATVIEVTFANGHVRTLRDNQSGKPLSLIRLEPLHIASIYPDGNEDRLFTSLKDTPKSLITTLLLSEDKSFYTHFGVRPLAIVRALLANLKAGKTVQGGSTLTQQLVKNFFLSSERSLKRKIDEALMALILEYRYTKDVILEAYCNEIYLGQNGQLAIHGFAMASRFYFARNLDELTPDQIALLVGLAKGASYYNPRHHPERAKKRRNHILSIMGQAGILSQTEIKKLQAASLGVSKQPPPSLTRYPAFLQLVRRQLQRDYQDKDLQNEGLSIFTTLDPLIQQHAEESLSRVLDSIEHQRKMTPSILQGALVICSVEQGEILAVVGDRDPAQAGFNRALEMKRPVGSVIKPAVYLTALKQPERYNLLSPLYDTPITIAVGETNWHPENYDKKYHGTVTLMHALEKSLNVATVQLGMELGLDAVIDTLHKLGVTESVPPYPSLLLGAVELPPITVLQLFQTLGAGGYKTPLRSILAVTDLQHHLLQRYPLTVELAVDPGAVFCLTTALHEVTRSGTAHSLQRRLPKNLKVAGKTGTTDHLRDSWFAGFSGSHVAVAWVGRDDNHSTGLTGASGALQVWAAAMAGIQTTSLSSQAPLNIDFYPANSQAGSIYMPTCQKGTPLPFIRGGLLPRVTGCQENTVQQAPAHTKSLEQHVREGIQQFFRIFQ